MISNKLLNNSYFLTAKMQIFLKRLFCRFCFREYSLKCWNELVAIIVNVSHWYNYNNCLNILWNRICKTNVLGKSASLLWENMSYSIIYCWSYGKIEMVLINYLYKKWISAIYYIMFTTLQKAAIIVNVSHWYNYNNCFGWWIRYNSSTCGWIEQ
jgi:hypothetical protein